MARDDTIVAVDSATPATDPPESESRLVATACRVLAASGLAPDILGHISVRLPGDRLAVRCRGPRERGLAHTEAADIRVVPLHGASELDGWSAPNELPLHTGILRSRPDVTAVVHAHPPAVVTMSIAGLAWLPIVGAYDIPAARLAADGIPVWPRSVLVNNDRLGDELAGCLGDRPAAVLRGHGLVSTGRGTAEQAVAEAVVTAVAIDSLARMTLSVRAAGSVPHPIDAADLVELPDLGPRLNVDAMWRFLTSRVTPA